MKYWVFTEEQLDNALAAFGVVVAEPGVEPAVVIGLIREFLDSDAARRHKLMGGRSYTPKAKP